ncbi:transglutaminase-like domain-containing protein [bacterium]|nr:transglutaminase-like domain-containing protein [bacterium]
MKKVIIGLIVGFWLVMMGLLLVKEGLLPTKRKVLSYKEFLSKDIPFQEEWMGIYFNREKIGYSWTTINPHPKGFMVNSRASIFVSLCSKNMKMDITGLSIIDKDYRLSSFHYSLLSSDHKAKIKGRVEKDKLFLSVLTGEVETERIISLKENPLLSDLLTPFRAFPRLDTGKEYLVSIIDPLSLALDTVKIKVTGKDSLLFEDKPLEVVVLNLDYKGISTKVFTTPDGRILKCETPFGLTLIKESAEDQTEFEKGSLKFDIAGAVSIPSNVKIKSFRDVRFLRARITGVDLSRYRLADSRQKVLDNNLVEISAPADNKEAAAKIPISKYEEFLEPTLFIQSEDERITEKAGEIIGDEDNACLAAKKLLVWMGKNLKKSPTLSIPSAIDVLESKTGDCNEYAVLFAALAKSVGIPTKICIGLVYYEGSFYYHAWVKSYLGYWCDIDPVLGQMPVDATHIKFIEGDPSRQADILDLIGRVKIEVLEYK